MLDANTLLDTNTFIDSYISWLKQNTTALKLESGAVEISSPFLDRNNDYIQIYIVPDGDGYRLSDDGYTLSDLELSGLKFNTSKRKEELNTILRGFGIQLNGTELYCKCSSSNFPIKKHNLMQAILAVNDLFVLSQPNVISLFLQDVESFLKENNIRYMKNIKFAGKSGFDHAYDFAIPQSQLAPERLLKTVNNLERSIAQNIIFSWNDTIQVREPGTKLYTFINDKGKQVPDTCIEALKEYGIKPITWSSKSNIIKELSA